MLYSRDQEVIQALHSLDNCLFNTDGCIVIYAGGNDNGERYIDISYHKDHTINSITIADYIGAEDLMEALVELNRIIEEEK